METVLREKETMDIFKNDDIKIEIIGQNVERSFEDRDVYINFKMNSFSQNIWIRGEESIKIGQILINQIIEEKRDFFENDDIKIEILNKNINNFYNLKIILNNSKNEIISINSKKNYRIRSNINKTRSLCIKCKYDKSSINSYATNI
jgi:hypothetical protein